MMSLGDRRSWRKLCLAERYRRANVSLADTVGTASPDDVAARLRAPSKAAVAGVEIGVHLHSRPDRAAEKVLAAYEAGLPAI